MTDQLARIHDTISYVCMQLRDLQKEVRVLQKAQARHTELSPRAGKGGLYTPLPVCDELSDFMGKARGEKVSRVEVLRFLHSYIRAHDMSIGHGCLRMDDALFALLGGAEREVKYFAIAGLMQKLFLPVTRKRSK